MLKMLSYASKDPDNINRIDGIIDDTVEATNNKLWQTVEEMKDLIPDKEKAYELYLKLEYFHSGCVVEASNVMYALGAFDVLEMLGHDVSMYDVREACKHG
jgi:hypothetical protein